MGYGGSLSMFFTWLFESVALIGSFFLQFSFSFSLPPLLAYYGCGDTIEGGAEKEVGRWGDGAKR